MCHSREYGQFEAISSLFCQKPVFILNRKKYQPDFMFLACRHCEWKTCPQSAWTRLQMITVSTHTNLIWSLGYYKRGQSSLKSRSKKQTGAVRWLSKQLTGKEQAQQNTLTVKCSETLSNKSECYTATAFCNTVHTRLHSTKMQEIQEVSRTGPSYTDITNAC